MVISQPGSTLPSSITYSTRWRLLGLTSRSMLLGRCCSILVEMPCAWQNRPGRSEGVEGLLELRGWIWVGEGLAMRESEMTIDGVAVAMCYYQHGVPRSIPSTEGAPRSRLNNARCALQPACKYAQRCRITHSALL